MIVTFDVPPLVNVMFCEELLPTFTLPKAKLDGLAVNSVVEARPVPVRPID